MHKLRYTMKGGALFTGVDKYHIVEQLAESSFAPHNNLQDWMCGCSKRIKIQFGYDIDYYNADSFVDQLVFYGLLIPVEE